MMAGHTKTAGERGENLCFVLSSAWEQEVLAQVVVWGEEEGEGGGVGRDIYVNRQRD